MNDTRVFSCPICLTQYTGGVHTCRPFNRWDLYASPDPEPVLAAMRSAGGIQAATDGHPVPLAPEVSGTGARGTIDPSRPAAPVAALRKSPPAAGREVNDGPALGWVPGAGSKDGA